MKSIPLPSIQLAAKLQAVVGIVLSRYGIALLRVAREPIPFSHYQDIAVILTPLLSIMMVLDSLALAGIKLSRYGSDPIDSWGLGSMKQPALTDNGALA